MFDKNIDNYIIVNNNIDNYIIVNNNIDNYIITTKKRKIGGISKKFDINNVD
jgi:hypothetical protein